MNLEGLMPYTEYVYFHFKHPVSIHCVRQHWTSVFIINLVLGIMVNRDMIQAVFK